MKTKTKNSKASRKTRISNEERADLRKSIEKALKANGVLNTRDLADKVKRPYRQVFLHLKHNSEVKPFKGARKATFWALAETKRQEVTAKINGYIQKSPVRRGRQPVAA